MGTEPLTTDKNFYMKIFELALNNFDEFKDKYSHYFAANISYNFFDSRLGDYVISEGRDGYFEFLKTTSSMYDFAIDDVTISQDGDKIFMFYHQITTERSPHYDKNLAPVEGLSVQYIENNQIVQIKNMFDTFQVLRQIGKVVLRSQDKERINHYLQNLINIGLIKSEYIT